MENREECDTEGNREEYVSGKEQREESDTHVMDTKWRTEWNAIQRENRGICIREVEEGGK